MPVTPDVLKEHLIYTSWASKRLLEAALKLTPEELTRDFGTADRSVLGSLVHIFEADRSWLARVEGAPPVGPSQPKEQNLPALQIAWPDLYARWLDWASRITPISAATEIAYRDWTGNEWRQPLWQIVLHVVNHGTHHRGQVSGFLRALGHVPPPIDLSFYYRKQ